MTSRDLKMKVVTGRHMRLNISKAVQRAAARYTYVHCAFTVSNFHDL